MVRVRVPGTRSSKSRSRVKDVHLVELGLRTAGNLLCPQLHQLALELVELLLQLLLVLAPELGGLDLAGGLSRARQYFHLT